MKKILTIKVNEVIPYINWIYFFHAWGFEPRFSKISLIHGCDACRAMWLASFPQKERNKAAEAMQLYKEAQRLFLNIENKVCIQMVYKLCAANSNGNNILIGDICLPLLRQQTIHIDDTPHLCLSDFIRPLSSGVPDTIGIFAASASLTNDANVFLEDSYKYLLLQTLNDRLVEAAVEKTHEEIRRKDWGYAPHEQLTIPELLEGKFQGIRPAVGYPSLPDQSINFILDELLNFKEIGISLTENGAMQPHSSVSGLMISHPASHYFSVGKIDKVQLMDYSLRRGIPFKEMKKFLTANCDF